jgi:hypothetical protein
MTAKVNRSLGQYFSVPDAASLTLPEGDWTIGGLIVLDGLTTGDNGQYLFSTGGYQTAGALNVLYQTAGNAAQPSALCFTRSTVSDVRASTSKFLTGDALIWILQHTNGMLSLRTCKVRNVAPTDGSVVVLENSDQALTTALDGPSGLIFGGRADLAANRFADQSIGRFFCMLGLLTDFEVAKLSYGMEITDLGKTPLWYFRLDTATDTADRGSLGLTLAARGSGTIGTGTAPAFGYTGTASPATPAPTAPTVSAAPMTAERIYQRAGTSLAIAMSGLWSVTKPDAIEYQLYAEDGATVLMPWGQIPGATINADGTWSGTPAVPQGPVLLQHGLYRRRVRAKSGGAVLSTADIETNLFGVGDLFGHTGSSSSSLLFTYESGTGFTPAANVRVYHNSNTTWTRFGTDGAAIAMANALAAKAGVPVGFIAYGWGGTQLAQWLDKTGPRWTSFAAAVAANGGKLAGVITTVGSNDANDGIVVSRQKHLDNLRQFFDNHRVLTSQPNLPFGLTGFNRRPTANAQQADWVRQAESIIGDDPSVYHVQVLDLELHSDLTHLSRTSTGGFRYSAERGGNVFGDAIYKGIYRRGPKIISFTYLGNKIYVDLQHRNGTDISPAAAINGFLVSDSSGAALSYSAARDSAGRIVITCNRDLVGTVIVKYLSGSSPVSSTTAAPTNEVFDNGAMALPMTMEAELVAIQASDTEIPVFTGSTSVSSTWNSATVSYPAATDNVAVAGYEYSLNSGSSWAATGSTGTSFTLSGLTAATPYSGLVRAIDTSNLRSNALAFSFTTAAAPDTTAPTLSNPTASQTGQTTATGSVTTTEAGGTLYRLASRNATESVAAVKAGQSSAVAAAGAQAVSFTGLTAGTTYYGHFLHRDAAGNESAVANTAAFTTGAESPATVTNFTPSSSRTLKVLAGHGFSAEGAFWDLSNPDKPVGTMDSSAVLDIVLDWTGYLVDIGSPAIGNATITVAGVQNTSPLGRGNLTILFASAVAGAVGAIITFKIWTATTPQVIDERTVYLKFEDK